MPTASPLSRLYWSTTMAGPYRVKATKKIKLRGTRFPFNDALLEEDPSSQAGLLPVQQLSLTATQKRATKSSRLVSREFAS
jgi:hypothetical protein